MKRGETGFRPFSWKCCGVISTGSVAHGRSWSNNGAEEAGEMWLKQVSVTWAGVGTVGKDPNARPCCCMKYSEAGGCLRATSFDDAPVMQV